MMFSSEKFVHGYACYAMCLGTGIRLCWSYYSLVLLHKSEYKSIIWNKLLLNYLWLWIDFTFFHIALQKPFLFKFESHSTEEDRISALICILCVRKAIQCFQVYLLFYFILCFSPLYILCWHLRFSYKRKRP